MKQREPIGIEDEKQLQGSRENGVRIKDGATQESYQAEQIEGGRQQRGRFGKEEEENKLSN